MDKTERSGIRICDLMDKEIFAKKLKLQVDAKNKLVKDVYGKEAMFDFETIYNEYLGYAEKIRNLCCRYFSYSLWCNKSR